ncbi:MAG: Uncharacterized conserved protein GlcG, DUF336 family [Chloroflexi bacterium]|jgi:glc operon protein GlcG|nr:MAG: Uncharacterized conserved protein GlcG, DUF336 family [Chloroflexota bacterium]
MAKIRAVDCHPFFEAVTEKASAMGVPVAMAVVNAEGHLIALERMDDAGFITPDIAYAKAYTVAAFRSMSPRFPDGLLIRRWFQERNPQMMVNASVMTGGKVVASGGSTPIFVGDELVGAYGVSGGTSEQDEVIGQHARGVVGWQSRAASD